MIEQRQGLISEWICGTVCDYVIGKDKSSEKISFRFPVVSKESGGARSPAS
jgi:hypothetical protein